MLVTRTNLLSMLVVLLSTSTNSFGTMIGLCRLHFLPNNRKSIIHLSSQLLTLMLGSEPTARKWFDVTQGVV